MTAVPSRSVPNPSEPLRQHLQSVLARLPGAPLLTGCERLSGGASQETWLLRLAGPAGADRLILRRSPQGNNFRRAIAAGLGTEAQVITLAQAAGVPVPGIVATLIAKDELGEGFLCQYVEGESIPRRILRDARFEAVRPRLARQCGEVLARIHAIEMPPTLPLQELPAAAKLEQLELQYRRQQLPRPVFEFALRWLHQHLPRPAAAPCLVHGDFRNGNLLIDHSGIAAVLDWELAHRGEALEDLGWLCVPSWRFGLLDRPVGGFGHIEELIAGYEGAGGARVDRQRLFFWTVFGSLFWGVTCTEFALEFRRGDRALERAVIGRRSSETELDLLWLLDAAGAARRPAPP